MLLFIFFTGRVGAVSGIESWGTGAMLPVASAPTVSPHYQDIPCGGREESIDIRSFGHDEYGCVFGMSGEVRVARYFHPTERFKYAVAFPGEQTFSMVTGFCEGMARCQYATAGDIALVEESVGWNRYSAKFVDGFARRLEKNSSGYSLRADDGDLYVSIGSTRAYTGSLALSPHGSQAVVEIMDYGIVVVDKGAPLSPRLIAQGARYGYGHDPVYEFGVTDDGFLVIIGGVRYGLNVISTKGCGIELATGSPEGFSDYSKSCSHATLDAGVYFPGFRVARSPRLSPTGSYAYAHIQGAASEQWVQFKPTDLPPGTVVNESPSSQLVALGDSFTSGEGETDDTWYISPTNSKENKCHLSRRSYPYLIGIEWSVSVKSVACSGARIPDIFLARGSVDPQLRTVEESEPSVVTLSIGGNDVGMMDKLRACVGFDTCEWAKQGVQRKSAGEEIQSLFTTLVQAINRISQSVPGAKIAIVGYPDVINSAKAARCDFTSGLLLDETERLFMKEAVAYLNEVISSAARRAGAVYISIQDAYVGERLCEGDHAAMNGVRFGDDIAPLGILPKLRIIGAESFHPTPDGHRRAASAIASQTNWSTLAAQPIATSTNIATPELPAFWSDGVDGEVPAVAIHSERLTADEQYLTGDSIFVRSSKYRFAPNSSVQVHLNSAGVDLGSYDADIQGSVGIKVRLPDKMPSGFHTLHVYGTSPGGAAVDVYSSLLIHEQPSVDESVGTLVPTGGLGGDVLSVSGTDGIDSSLGDFAPGIQTQLGVNSTGVVLGVAAQSKTTADTPDDGEGGVAYRDSLDSLYGLLVVGGIIGGLGWLFIAKSKKRGAG